MRNLEYFASDAPDPRARRDGITVPKIWVTVLLSVLIHALVLWQLLPQIRKPSSDADQPSDAQGPLSVQLAPRASPRPAPPRPASPPQPRRQAELRPAPSARAAPQRELPKATPRPEAKPPVIALNRPAPSGAPPQRAITPPAPPPTPATGDLASYIEAQRQARGEAAPAPASPPESAPSAAPTEDPNARANRLAAANLGIGNKPNFGADPRRGGGVFQIQRLTYDYAEFLFYGWNKDIRRNTQQVIEVRKGGNSDIRIAVVRRMIAIIRDYEQGDFVWESHRLGRKLTLSARARDTAGLEDFMMREFFDDDRRP